MIEYRNGWFIYESVCAYYHAKQSCTLSSNYTFPYTFVVENLAKCRVSYVVREREIRCRLVLFIASFFINLY